jgi:hypothetical protein
VKIQPTTGNNSTTAFQVQNSSGTSLFAADTTNSAIVLGGGDGTASLSGLTVRGPAGTGTNIQGVNLTFDASNGTGSAGSGDFVFRTAASSAAATPTISNNTGTGTANFDFGSVASGGNATSGANFTVANNTNRILVVGVSLSGKSPCTTSGVYPTVNTVKWGGSGGTALTQLSTQNAPWASSDNTVRNEIWYLKAPTATATTLYVALNTNASSCAADVSIGAVAIYNVDQGTGTFGTPFTNSGNDSTTEPNNTVTGTNSNQLVLHILSENGNGVTTGSGETQQWAANNFTAGSFGYTKTGVNGSTTFSSTISGSGSNWADIAFAVNAVGGSTANTLTDRLHISASGNVGIGTATPTATLNVVGTDLFKASSNSSTQFQIQNATSVALFTVDSTNARLYVGPTAGDTVGTLLVLGNKTNAGDPTEVDGAMYYNSSMGAFRCGVKGAWESCLTGKLASNTATSTISTCTTACGAFNVSQAGTTQDHVTLPANFCTAGKVFRISAWGVYSYVSTATLQTGVYYGTSSTRTSDTVLGALSLNQANGSATGTNQTWHMDWQMTCLTTGASGTVAAQGMLVLEDGAGTSDFSMNATGTQTFDTTAATNLYIFPVWSASSASNTITLHTVTVTAE